MGKALSGLLGAALIFGLLAGMSGASHVNQQVRHLQDRWATIQSLPVAGERLILMKDLQRRADELSRKYPENDDVSRWATVIDRTTSTLKARRRIRG